MKTVYLVQHLHMLPDEIEDVKTIGIYSSRETAEAAVDRLKHQPGFQDLPNLVDEADFSRPGTPEGFYIDAYEIDSDHWESGYITT